MLKGIDAVLFDLDGTLVDSMWMWGAIDREYLARPFSSGRTPAGDRGHEFLGDSRLL